MLNQFIGISPKSDLLLLQLLGAKLYKRSFLHINSTRVGGGVAEIKGLSRANSNSRIQ